MSFITSIDPLSRSDCQKMKTLNYPYNLSKSSFVNFSSIEREPDEIDDFDGEEKEAFCVSCYEEIMAENNP